MSTLRSRLTGYWPLLWIAILVSVLYGSSVTYTYIFFDDNVLIKENFHFIRNLGNIGRSFLTDVFMSNSSFYRPILTISFILDAQMSQYHLWMYHITNMAIHTVACWAFFVFLTNLGADRLRAFTLAIIVAVHPVLVPAVAWVPARDDSLQALFIVSAFIFLDKLIHKPTRNAYWALHFLFYCLALFTKESSIIALPLFVGFVLVVRPSLRKRKESITLGLLWLLSTAGYLFMRRQAMGEGIPLDEAIYSVMVNWPCAVQVLGKLLLPFNLSEYPTMTDTTLLYGGITFGVICLFLSRIETRHWLHVLFGLSWCFLFLLPVYSANPNQPVFVSESRAYLPLLGILIALMQSPCDKHSGKRSFWVAGIVVFVFASLSISRLPHFRNAMVFWENAVKNSPGAPMAHGNLGTQYSFNEEMDKAEESFQEALRLNPEQPKINANMGVIHAARGQFDRAEEFYLREIEINPGYVNSYFNLGLLYAMQDRQSEAVPLWEKTISLNPHHVRALEYLVHYYLNQQDLENTTRCALQLSRIKPLHPQVVRFIQGEANTFQ